jgi:hypothetical protein
MSARLLALLLLAAPAGAQSVLTVGDAGEFATPQAAIDAAVPGDIVLLLQSFEANVVIDKGIALVGSGQTLLHPASALDQPTIRVTGVPAGQAVLISGVSVFVFGDGAPAAVEVSGCDAPVWIQDVFVDSYGATGFAAHDARSLVLANSAFQTNLVAALPDGTPKTAPGALLTGTTSAFVHGGHVLGSHGVLQGPGFPVPTAAPDGGAGLIAVDAQVKVTGTTIAGGSGNSVFIGGCNLGGDGGAGLVTLDGPAAGLPAVLLRGAAVTGGGGGFSSGGCSPQGQPGAAFDVLPGSVTTQAVLPRHFALPGHVQAGLPITLAFDGAPGDVALLFGAASAAPALAVGALDLHLSAGTLFPVGVFALAGFSLDVPASVPALPPGLQGVIVPLQAVFVDAQGGKHGAAPRALVIH